ncbi:MAG: hypothetical protein DCC75_10635, partial [Proteobacteria bacterium]
MHRFLLLILSLTVSFSALAEVELIAVKLNATSKGRTPQVNISGGSQPLSAAQLSAAAKHISELQGSGSSMLLYIQADQGIAWRDVQTLIDAANKNPNIEIKSI